MKHVLRSLLTRLSDPKLRAAAIIPWGSPIPAFGNLANSHVATLGLNPSNREFVDAAGNELTGQQRRFETLRSLGLENWGDASSKHVTKILDSLQGYFSNNPYDLWFKKLDVLISRTGTSYYCGTATHLDLIPFATSYKWGELSHRQRDLLLAATGNTLGLLLRDSPVRVLILNGASVVTNFQKAFALRLETASVPVWTLRSKSATPVVGYSYKATVNTLAGVPLKRRLLVLGFNHNIQSSFGVTRQVSSAIGRWIGSMSEEYVVEA